MINILPKYSSKFLISDYNNIDLIVSFEVFEHMSEPNNEIDFLFKTGPNSVFISTLFYNNNEKIGTIYTLIVECMFFL